MFNNQNSTAKMKEYFDINVANDVVARRKYVSPEIEVINLDEQPKLLSASTGGASGTAGWGNGLSDDKWDE